jgi:DNA polymerase-3 subunit delta
VITLFYGSDTYRMSEDARAFVARHRAGHGSDALTTDLADGEGLERILGALATPSFFGERRLAVAHDPLGAEDVVDLLKENGAAKNPDADLLLLQPLATKPTAAQAKELKRLAALADAAVAYEPLGPAEARTWIGVFCAQRDRSIEPDAAAELHRRTGGDTWRLAQELEKLCAYAPATVTAADVGILVAQPPSSDQWELSNALSGHDKRGSIAALWRKVREGTPEPLLVGAVAASLRTLVMVGDLSANGQPAAAIARSAGLHPFVVSKTLAGARQYRPEGLRSAHLELARLDRLAKTGAADAVDGLFSILIGL